MKRGGRRGCGLVPLALCESLMACLWLAGCTATVRPPADALVEPTTVFLIFDDRHRGLLLPVPDRGFVEFDYGEWGWYAEGRDAWYRVFPVVLWPTRGALGRRLVSERDGEGLRRRWPWVQIEPIRVERVRADALRERLEAVFRAGIDERHRNPGYGLEFVPCDEGFWCLFNCNDAVTGWLAELGCSVTWVPIRLDLSVARAKP